MRVINSNLANTTDEELKTSTAQKMRIGQGPGRTLKYCSQSSPSQWFSYPNPIGIKTRNENLWSV